MHLNIQADWKCDLSVPKRAVALLLAKASWAFVLEERTPLFTAGSLAVPGWPFALILPIGFLLVAVHSGLRLWVGKVPEENPRG